ncbi:MAG: helix-turn-helix domain-containing protein, partial [Nitrospinota bacterium]|nr:helix-turn-helix domain-containing protein [Nitrospinota bacterium]
MGKIYKQLGIKERERVMVLHSLGWSHGRMACDIGRPKSTVTREIQRNREPGGGLYSARDAAKRSRERKWQAGRRERLKTATVRLYMRPASADDRSGFGHWEADSIVSRASKVALNV